MNETIAASSPDQNAIVMASAGTGKTWLLVTRILRLLMDGIQPDTILAITFTRKAAAEMQVRLFDRLFVLMTLDDQLLAATLEKLGISTTDESMLRARGLYENLLHSERRIRITTFHAFCNEILKRFPIEANVPPGFDLLENSGLLEQEAYDALFNEATSEPEGELVQALDRLLSQYGSTFALRAALDEFMQHRADWWAFTRLQDRPVDYACRTLASQLQIDTTQDPYSGFFNDDLVNMLQEFMALLDKHPTRTNQKSITAISTGLESNTTVEQRIGYIKGAFLTKEGKPLSRKPTKTREKAMGPEGETRFLEIHHACCERLAALQEHERRILTYNTSRAWYIAGAKLLGHYQRIKLEQRQLDFADLEIRVYELLNHSNNALWIQYKLDQRIDHLLIDEFQDTNPTQWRMILPLLNELAAGRHEHIRSVFVVGDSKQSIYRFRRADPRLVSAAHDWLEKYLDTKQYPLDVSWRSSPAIIDFLNQVFGKGTLGERLASYHTHDTHLRDLWGKVEMLPLIRTEKPGSQDSLDELRNPLNTPRIIDEDLRHYDEGKLIAGHIRNLVQNGAVIGHDKTARPLTYSDIIILVRNRTHMTAYEKALRNALIPYQSTGKTTLLDSLEVQDIIALLETLITPYNNLALASILRSPLFACSDEDLMLIASHTSANSSAGGNLTWLERLATIAPTLDKESPLKRAHHWLTIWRSLAGKLPVHDLLDRIFSEGNVFERYQAVFPAHLQHRVIANLSRFIELALEIDSGRYPSLPLFLSRLRALRQYARNALDEPPATGEDSVRVMTIHAAKGLEAAVVFLADSTKSNSGNRSREAIITWPGHSDKPDHYFITGKKSEMDQWSRSLFDQTAREELQEETNLLYVALSRAKQLLFISGCTPVRGNDLGWYGLIAENLADDTGQIIDKGYTLESGHPPSHSTFIPPVDNKQAITPDPRLARPLSQAQRSPVAVVSPSDISETSSSDIYSVDEDDGKLRGNVIHRLLALLTVKQAVPEESLLQHVADEFALDKAYHEFSEWREEVNQLIHRTSLRDFFDPARFISAYNEIPVQYYVDGRLVYGIIDRLIVNDDSIVVIDYKTHRHANPDNLTRLAAPYCGQLRMYGNGIEKIWPGKPVRPILLFTACATAYELNQDISTHP